MQIQHLNDTLLVHSLNELSAANARFFREECSTVLSPETKVIEIDLAQTSVVDSAGLAALVSLHRTAHELRPGGGPILRLLNPQPSVLQLLELTRLHHLFEIVAPPVRTEPEPAPSESRKAEHRAESPSSVTTGVPTPKLQST